MNPKLTLSAVLILSIFFLACKNTNENREKISDVKDSTPNKVQIAYDKAKEVLYSLPSPVETAMIIENTKVKFSDEYILPLNKIVFYETSFEKAVNLGVYSADLSYLSMFEQQQTAVKYLTNCKKLAEELGVLDVINDSVIDDLSKNIKRKEEVLEVISEQYMNINAFLEENNREQLAALMVFGGWIEGIYISIKLVNNDVATCPDLVQTIYDQKLSLEDLQNLIKLFNDNPNMKAYYNELNDLSTIFNSVSTPLNQKDFDKIQNKIVSIRNQITKSKNN